MSGKLAITALVALSVTALADSLAAEEYTVDEINEALEAEISGQNRSTAVKEIKAALADAMAGGTVKENTAGTFVRKGKSITTRAGIKVGGDQLYEGDLPEDALKQLAAKGYVEERE